MDPQPERKILHAILVPIGWLLGTLIVLFGAAVAYYSFDDELSPDARALLAAPKLGEPTDANGYVAFLGMGAPSGHDQMAWGRKVLAALRAHDAEGFKKDAAWENTIKPQLALSKGVVAWCSPEKQSCLAVAREKGEALAKLLEDNREMLARYRTMRDKPVFDDAYFSPRADAPLPPYQLMNSQWLALLAVIRQAAASDLDGAIGELEQETAFHGRLAAGARHLIGKSVAAALIARDALVLSDLIAASKGGIAPYGARIEAMARRLEADLTLREAWVGWEIYVGAWQAMELRRRALYGSPDARGNVLIDTLGALIYRPNASVNDLVASHKEQLAILGKGSLNFDEALAKAGQATRRLESPSWIDVLRNPVGSLLLSMGPVSYGEFFARTYNVAGLLRLLALQAAVVARGIEAPEAIAQFLASEAAKPYADPFTGKPMAWDGSARQLYFQPRGREAGWIEALKTRYDGRIAVAL